MTKQDKFLVLNNFEKKQLVELMVEQVLTKIEKEKRPLTKWESDHIRGALAFITSGLYSAAKEAAALCYANKAEISEPEKWFSPDNTNTITDFKNDLDAIRKSSPRKI